MRLVSGLRLRLYSSPVGLYLIAEGVLDTGSVHQLTRAVDLAIHRLNPARFTVDVGGLDFVDVAGVATLIACRRQAHARGVGFRIVQPTAQIKATASACGAGDLLCPPDDNRPQPAGALRRRSHLPGLNCLRAPRHARRASRGQASG
ncbi:STAS domain-containing protein [Catellatospora sichuanensis]|uniref:STAS domain-containing protein n=1 Tax=Catellatospora sichuanensis TaxID=1969805 RepID=UPI0016434749|nr:STAS domain-containing protein [Catellatospora sichuanensis]